MFRAYKYRLWTNEGQAKHLGVMLDTHRHLYNQCLSQRIESYKTNGKGLSYADQSRWFTTERERNRYFSKLNVSSAQATLRRLDQSFRNFFRRCRENAKKPGFPRFKGPGQFNSIEFKSYGSGLRLNQDAGKLRLQHVGLIRTKIHRRYEGNVKTAKLLFEADKWYVILFCDVPTPMIPQSPNPPVGIDLGLEHFLTTSDGVHEPNPRFLRNELPKMRRLQRAISRKVKEGSNFKKAVAHIRKVHIRIRNLRRDYHYKTAIKLVSRYGIIAVECLNIQGMLRSRRYAQAISDAGWFSFRSILDYKAESAGVAVVDVNPAGTSQICSMCGAEVRKHLFERWHTCPCGCSLQRDVNAARNILARGLVRIEPAKRNVDVSLHVSRILYSANE